MECDPRLTPFQNGSTVTARVLELFASSSAVSPLELLLLPMDSDRAERELLQTTPCNV